MNGGQAGAVVLATLIGLAAANAADGGSVADGGDAAADAGADADADGRADATIVTLGGKAAAVRALIAGEVHPTVVPATLFDIPIGDEEAVSIEAQRLRALLRDLDAPPRTRASGKTRRRQPAAAPGPAADAGAGVYPHMWAARIQLDRARLAFYDLPLERRRAIIAAQAPPEPEAPVPAEADRADDEAEAQHQEALQAAQRARSQAERLVVDESTRLLDVQRAQASFAEGLSRKKRQIRERADATIGWQQRALEARQRPGPSADRTYDDLRRALRSARQAFSEALDQMAGDEGVVPGPGADALVELRVDVDTRAVRKKRDEVEAEARRLASLDEGVRHERATALFDEINKLNRERLALLAALSPQKRDAVTGFTAAGWDQAFSEARHLALVLRYHRRIIGEQLIALRHPGRALKGMFAGGVLQVLEWLLAIGAFVWWRRRSTPLLMVLCRRAEQDDRRARLPGPSPATRALLFVAQVHRPVEWLALLVALTWLLPASTQQILEVRVVSVLITWIFGAALVVDVINAAAGTKRGSRARPDSPDSGALRLRSLRLVGRVVVTFGLILVISAMLVGRGTIYQWVFSTCWLASFPVLVVIVRWWRDIVFDRTELVRRPARIQLWALAHRQGLGESFLAAAVGGTYLFASGAARGARNWIGRFVVTRRALAYLFRRQLDKRVDQTSLAAPIPQAAFEALGPEIASTHWISNDSDESIDRLAARIRERRGGVIAIVGERGMGKSATLRRLAGDGNQTILIDAPSADADALRLRLAGSLGLPPQATLEQEAAALSASPTIHALLLDNAHRFVQPVMGGLALFDTLLGTASRHTETTTWVFALDQVIWPFLERARGAQPLFDEVIRLEPWREEEIMHLLRARTEEVGLSPSFQYLLERLPATADEVDRQDALAQSAADYYRLLWDSAMGNPGIALHMWRRSLGTDTDGATAVRPSSGLDAADLERLPDSTAFVLRAVLQLAPVRAEQIVQGTLLRLAEVTDALRYATARGYIEERDGGYRVTWTWFRTITLFLRRKHLLVSR